MQENPESVERRKFLGKLTALAVSVLGGFAAFIAGGFLYPVQRRKPPALFVCLESELPPGRPLEIKDPKGRSVLLMRKTDGPLLAVGTVCSHLGCQVFYRPKKKQFDCPCHEGVFDAEGNPVSGPPRLPLDRYPTQVRRGKVFVQFS